LLYLSPDPTKFPKPSFSEKAWYPSTLNNLNVELKKRSFLLREESNRREVSGDLLRIEYHLKALNKIKNIAKDQREGMIYDLASGR
jgi:hypothetical protein